jgi:hypothetical protein
MKRPIDTVTGFLFPLFWLDVRYDQLWRGVQALAQVEVTWGS